MGRVGVDGGGASTVVEGPGDAVQTASAWTLGWGELHAIEHPAVLGARIGACVFASFTLPVLWWILGETTATSAALLAAAFTVAATKATLTLGGLRIWRVLLVQIAVSAWVFHGAFSVPTALVLALFVPLTGMLATVSVCAKIAGSRFAAGEPFHEADEVVARATQPNVVDIRAAGAGRRTGAKKGTGPVRSADAVALTPKTHAG
jgi:hypothetical protein